MLQPIAEAKLSSPEGLVVQRIHVKEGDRVKKGQELITYDSGAAERELEDEIMNLHKQKLELQEIQDQFIQSMREEDEFASRKIKRNIESMQLVLVRQQRKMDEASERLEKLRHLIAPFDGWVMEVNAAEVRQSVSG